MEEENLEIASLIKSWLQTSSINQKSLAEKISISPSHMSRVLKGSNTLENSKLKAIAEVLKEDFSEVEKIKSKYRFKKDDIPAFVDHEYISSLLQKIGSGDEVHVISSYEFTEAKNYELLQGVFSAMRNGAIFKYFYPEEVIDKDETITLLEKNNIKKVNHDIEYIKKETDRNGLTSYLECKKRDYINQNFTPYAKIIGVYSPSLSKNVYSELVMEITARESRFGKEYDETRWVRLSTNNSIFFLNWCKDDNNRRQIL